MVDVSIIIPTYNRLWCLPRAIDSCRKTFCKAEIIVVDDGSTDGTWEWLQTQKDIIKVRQENQGQTYALNKGFSISTGKFIRFLDSDDFLVTGIIDAQYKKGIDTDADLIYSRVDIFEEKTQKIIECPQIEFWPDFLELQLSNRYGSHFLGMLFRRKLIEQVPRRSDFALREDRMFLLEVGLLNPKLALVEGCAGYWVRHPEQMQSNYSGIQSQVTNWQHLNIFKRVLTVLQRDGQLTEARKKAACTVLWPLAHWIAKNHLSEAAEVVKWINRLDPEFEIPEKGILGILYKNIGFVQTERVLHLRRKIKYFGQS